MNLETGWLERQLECAASEFDKWPNWMKESAEKEERESQRDTIPTISDQLECETP